MAATEAADPGRFFVEFEDGIGTRGQRAIVETKQRDKGRGYHRANPPCSREIFRDTVCNHHYTSGAYRNCKNLKSDPGCFGSDSDSISTTLTCHAWCSEMVW